MYTSTLGLRLVLRIGQDIAQPASYAVSTALTHVEVTDNAEERDGFQMTFTLSKAKADDYNLLKSGVFDPYNRVMLGILMPGATNPDVLMDGLITHHEYAPGNDPGTLTLTVTGEDISLVFDLEEKNIPYANLSDSQIVQQVLGQYGGLGLNMVVQKTDDTPHENQRITRQNSTDLKFLQSLAKRNGFVFYVDPDTVDASRVYWGIEDRKKTPQPALSMNMGSHTNVTSLTFSHNAMTPVTAKGSYIDPASKRINPVTPPSSDLPPLAATPTKNKRTVLLRNAGQRDLAQARLAASAQMSDNTKSVTGNGQLDTINYGYLLRAGELVGVRGTGTSYNGLYYVRQVKHTIERGTYTQSFSLSREGVGTTQTKIPPS